MTYAKHKTLEEFTIWHNKINETKGYGEDKPTQRHTTPIIKEGTPITYSNTYEADHKFWEGIKDLIPKTLITNEEYKALNWLPTEEIL